MPMPMSIQSNDEVLQKTSTSAHVFLFRADATLGRLNGDNPWGKLTQTIITHMHILKSIRIRVQFLVP